MAKLRTIPRNGEEKRIHDIAAKFFRDLVLLDTHDVIKPYTLEITASNDIHFIFPAPKEMLETFPFARAAYAVLPKKVRHQPEKAK